MLLRNSSTTKNVTFAFGINNKQRKESEKGKKYSENRSTSPQSQSCSSPFHGNHLACWIGQQRVMQMLPKKKTKVVGTVIFSQKNVLYARKKKPISGIGYVYLFNVL